MNNSEIAQLFRNIAAALIIKKKNRFRIMAYEKAADSIEHLTSEVKDIYDEGKLLEIPGIGPTIASHLEELMKTGKVRHFEDMFKNISPAVFVFLQIPGIGPKKAYQLTEKFGLNETKTAISRLKQIANQGKIAKLEGWGEKSQTELLKAIEAYKKGQIKEKRMPLPFADALAHEMINYLKKLPQVKQIDVLGSLRRKVATIGDIDMAVATNDAKAVIQAFVKYPKVRKIIDQGEKGATVRLSVGRQVDLRVQTPQAYGAMLQYFTGSKLHNIRLREYALKKGLSLSEYGIKTLGKVQNLKFKNPCLAGRQENYNSKLKIYEFKNEKDFYEALNLPYIPPEIREDRGEIEAALRQAQGKPNGLPKVVEIDQIKGDLHLHSDYNLEPSHDLGNSDLITLLQKAVSLNYEYIGISDHNPGISNHTPKQIVEIIKKRREKLEQIYYSCTKSVQTKSLTAGRQVKLLFMLEVDIDPKGNLSLPEDAFSYLDAVIVSIHSSFKMSKNEMTKRIIKGLSHPKAKILGHPTGRLLDKREGYEIDWPEIFQFCLENKKALEINAWPQRLDLPDMQVFEAVKNKVKMVINTDSHDVSHMTLMEYGVDVAKRGWAESRDILNTLGYNDFIRWIKS